MEWNGLDWIELNWVGRAGSHSKVLWLRSDSRAVADHVTRCAALEPWSPHSRPPGPLRQPGHRKRGISPIEMLSRAAPSITTAILSNPHHPYGALEHSILHFTATFAPPFTPLPCFPPLIAVRGLRNSITIPFHTAHPSHSPRTISGRAEDSSPRPVRHVQPRSCGGTQRHRLRPARGRHLEPHRALQYPLQLLLSAPSATRPRESSRTPDHRPLSVQTLSMSVPRILRCLPDPG